MTTLSINTKVHHMTTLSINTKVHHMTKQWQSVININNNV